MGTTNDVVITGLFVLFVCLYFVPAMRVNPSHDKRAVLEPEELSLALIKRANSLM